MARYRPIATQIWKDPDFQAYSPDQKLIFFYLISNEATTESGIYPVTPKTIANETDLKIGDVNKAFENGFKNIMYDPGTQTIFIRNFLRYNGRGRPELILRAIENEFTRIQTPLWNNFIERYPAYSKGLDVDSLPPHTPLSNTNTISIPIYKDVFERLDKSCQDLDKSGKIRHLEYVYLLPKEFETLKNKYGDQRAEKMVETLNEYFRANTNRLKKYTSHYGAINSWVSAKVLEQMPMEKGTDDARKRRFLERHEEAGKVV